MKRIALISAIAISGLLFNNKADAQIRIHLGLNFAPRPVVYAQSADYSEPANYDGDEDYYYLPDVDAYYSVPDQCYYYNNGGAWVSATYLPGAYRDYEWRSARRYEVRAPRPFMHADYYRARYNGVAFNGHWDRPYNRSYANNYNYNNDRRFDNHGWNNDNRRNDWNREQHFDNRGGDHGRFDQRGGWDRGNGHREGRF
ncbi:MAG: hypothetical protein JST50_23195 [Bacteroidetes bacterium]|jgi:hypothetical protein|nr:hypothetical protein [Bacteroidota bacterium]